MSRTDKAQAEFQPLLEACAAASVAELPSGVQDLSVREIRFVQELLTHGIQSRAYKAAGFETTDDASARSGACELMRKSRVMKFYRACLAKVSGRAELLIGRVWERSVLFHEKAKEAAQEVDALDELMRKSRDDEYGTTPKGEVNKTKSTYETRREKVMREEAHYTKLATQTDELLGRLLGKIKELHVEGGVTLHQTIFQGAPVTPAVMSELAQAQREVQQRILATNGGRN